MTKIKKSSGNIFKDLDLDDSGDLSLKAQLTRQIYNIIKQKNLSQAVVAELTGLKQPDVSKLLNARHTGFSSDRLMELLNKLGQDIEIIIKTKPPRRSTARLQVRMG